jgi:hypothetical protein
LFFVSAGDYFQLAEVFLLFFNHLLEQRLFTASCLHQHEQKITVASCVAVNNIVCQVVILSSSISKNMLLLRHIGRSLFPCAGHFY